MKHKPFVLIVMITTLILFFSLLTNSRQSSVSGQEAPSTHSDSKGIPEADAPPQHDPEDLHAMESVPVQQDDHTGHDHEATLPDAHGVASPESDDHTDHDHEAIAIQLDADSQRLIGLKTMVAQTGTLRKSITLTGRIKLNEDRLAHIAPVSGGIVRLVNKSVGDHVKQGEILAWIESIELGRAKIDYLDILSETSCCSIIYDRAQAIHDNTAKLIDLLQTQPDLEALIDLDGEMGVNRGLLIQAWSDFQLAQTEYNREKSLYDQNIVSQEDFLASHNQLQKAKAAYLAQLDTIQYQIKHDLLEAQRDRQMRAIALQGAERILSIMGMGPDEIQQLQQLASTSSLAFPATLEDCSDPNCESCQLVREENQQTTESFSKLSWYPLKSPFSGTIVERHISLGEQLNTTSNAFTMADLSTVWIDLDIYPNQLSQITIGRRVALHLSSDSDVFSGTISYLSPILDPETRTVTARIIATNESGTLRPGLFITAEIAGETMATGLVIPKTAVQQLEGKACVFVYDGEDFSPQFIETGRSNGPQIEVLTGLEAGQIIVSQGSFELKAKIVTSTLDSHAGHGH